MESPFLVVTTSRAPSLVNTGVTDQLISIRVYKLAAEKLMEHLETVAPLIKTVQFPHFHSPKLLCNGPVFGYLMNFRSEQSIVLFEKASLFDSATLPEHTQRNRIPLPNLQQGIFSVTMNATCLVFIQTLEDFGTLDHWPHGPTLAQKRKIQEQSYLCKKDFWNLNTVA